MSGQAAVQTQTIAKPTITPITSGVLQRQCACGNHTSAGGECEECKKKHEDGMLQRVAMSPSPVHEVPPIVHEVLRSPGQPLDAATRAFMEPRFGHDFSGVRVHNNDLAARSAQAVGARAYTVGQHIAFGKGRYAPFSFAGQRLLAHELTHTIQAGPTVAVPPVLAISPSTHPQEHLAARAAERMPFAPPVSGQLAKRSSETSVPSATGGLIFRDEICQSGIYDEERQECRMPTSEQRQASPSTSTPESATPASTSEIANLGNGEKLLRAGKYAIEELEPQAANELRSLFSPQSIAAMLVFAGVFLLSQATPAGWAADILAAGILVFSVIFIGLMLIDIIHDLVRFIDVINATTDDQLRQGGRALARAVVRGGIGIIIALLTHSARGGPRVGEMPLTEPAPPRFRQMVTPDGDVLVVPIESVPTGVQVAPVGVTARPNVIPVGIYATASMVGGGGGGGESREGDGGRRRSSTPEEDSGTSERPDSSRRGVSHPEQRARWLEQARSWFRSNRIRSTGSQDQFTGKIVYTNDVTGRGRLYYTIDEWHGQIEIFDYRYNHVGAMDLGSNASLPPKPGRRIRI